MSCFNPILVQFKRLCRILQSLQSIPFQSYLSPIQTGQNFAINPHENTVSILSQSNSNENCRELIARCTSSFQSYLSPIQTEMIPRLQQGLAGFNPILVQFKRLWCSCSRSAMSSVSILSQSNSNSDSPSWRTISESVSILSQSNSNRKRFQRQSCKRMFQSYLSPIQTRRSSRPFRWRSRRFNPILVQFKLPSNASALPIATGFNPILVQFKPGHDRQGRGVREAFQSYLSPIQTALEDCDGAAQRSFNPILVQFKLGFPSWSSPVIFAVSILSQSNSNSLTRRSLFSSTSSFNPILVQFKHPRTGLDHRTRLSFNPILVQFKRWTPDYCLDRLSVSILSQSNSNVSIRRRESR